MGLDGRDDLVASRKLAALAPILAGNRRHAVCGVGAAPGLERELIHAGQGTENPVRFVDDFQCALKRVGGLQRMRFSDFRTIDELLDRLRIVFHRAGSE